MGVAAEVKLEVVVDRRFPNKKSSPSTQVTGHHQCLESERPHYDGNYG